MWCNSVKCTYPKTIIIPYIIPFFDSLFVAFELTFLASDKQNAGTTQNAWIVLEGEERKYQEYSIENSAKNNFLCRGQTDTFKFATKILENLTHVTLGHQRQNKQTIQVALKRHSSKPTFPLSQGWSHVRINQSLSQYP